MSLNQLAGYVQELRYETLDAEVAEHALLVVRDTLGAMLAGATLPEVRELGRHAPSLGGAGQATLIGYSHTTGPHFAALVHGTGGVSLELDEGNQYAVNHPAVHILPAALALAEDRQKSGSELLAAFVAGYEVAVRIGKATHLREAVHPFGTHAIVGTASACSKLAGLDVEQTSQALELAAGMTIASSQSAANAGASVRNLATGWTNHNGLLAPLLVQAGFTAEPGAFEAVFGRVLGDHYSDDPIDDLGDIYYITRNYFKLHACSRWNHAPVEAVAALMERNPFDPEHVDQLTVWTYDPATRLDWKEPANEYAAKHSIPYNVAVRVVMGTNGLEAYTAEAVADPLVRMLAGKVVVREDSAFTDLLPDVRPARVEVLLHSGQTLTETVEKPRGGFDNPLTELELAEKFRQLAGQVLPVEAVTEIEAVLQDLSGLADLMPLSQLLKTGLL